MPGITIVQSAVGTYGALGSLDALPVAFTSDNSIGNILLAWVSSAEGGGLTGAITDSNGNTWELLPGVNLEDEFTEFYICTNCNAGANTVTAGGCIPSSTGGPNLVIVEIAPPPCPIGSTGIQAFCGDYRNQFVTATLSLTARYSANQGPWYHSLIVALYNNTNSESNTARTWVGGALIAQFPEFSGKNSGAIGYQTVAYPNSGSTVTFTPTPSTPALNPDENILIGVLFSTQA